MEKKKTTTKKPRSRKVTGGGLEKAREEMDPTRNTF